MASIKEQFEIPGRLKTWSYSLIGIGGAVLLYGMFTKGFSSDEHEQVHFWGTLMYNTIFWTLICNAAMFFLSFSAMAQAAWMQSFRRVPEAISTMVPIFGGITLMVLLYIIFDHKHHIYHWLDAEAVAKDPILKGKVGFLNPTFFVIWTTLTISLWSLFGYRMRQLNNQADVAPMDAPTAKAFNIQSIKNKGYLELTNNEHLHDIAKFMFAFSIFWTYLWFSQYMLIWYANIPEETVYFKHRVQGPYKGIFFLNLIINFLAPLLILMKRSAKRNYTLVAFMAVVIIFGHWIDFYQMVMGSLMKEHVELGVLDFGILAFFVGVMIFFVAKALASKPLIAKHHPFLKESIIHHT